MSNNNPLEVNPVILDKYKEQLLKQYNEVSTVNVGEDRLQCLTDLLKDYEIRYIPSNDVEHREKYKPGEIYILCDEAITDKECDLLLTSQIPTTQTLDKLRIKSNKSYVRVRNADTNKLFYVNKMEGECVEIAIDPDSLKKFDKAMKMNQWINEQAKTLSTDDLAVVASIIRDHTPENPLHLELVDPDNPGAILEGVVTKKELERALGVIQAKQYYERIAIAAKGNVDTDIKDKVDPFKAGQALIETQHLLEALSKKGAIKNDRALASNIMAELVSKVSENSDTPSLEKAKIAEYLLAHGKIEGITEEELLYKFMNNMLEAGISVEKITQELSFILATCIVNNAVGSVEAIKSVFRDDLDALFPLASQVALAVRSNSEDVFKKLNAPGAITPDKYKGQLLEEYNKANAADAVKPLTSLLKDYTVRYVRSGAAIDIQHKPGEVYIIYNDYDISDNNPLRFELSDPDKPGSILKAPITKKDLETEFGNPQAGDYCANVKAVATKHLVIGELEKEKDPYVAGQIVLETNHLLEALAKKIPVKNYKSLDSNTMAELAFKVRERSDSPPLEQAKIAGYLLAHGKTESATAEELVYKFISKMREARIPEPALMQELSFILAKCIVNNAVDSVEAINSALGAETIETLFPLASQVKLATQSQSKAVFQKLKALMPILGAVTLDSYKEKLYKQYTQVSGLNQNADAERIQHLTSLLKDYKVCYVKSSDAKRREKYKPGEVYILYNDKPITNENPLRVELQDPDKPGAILEEFIAKEDLEREFGVTQAKEFCGSLVEAAKNNLIIGAIETEKNPYIAGQILFEAQHLLGALSKKRWINYRALDSKWMDSLAMKTHKSSNSPLPEQAKIAEYLLAHGKTRDPSAMELLNIVIAAQANLAPTGFMHTFKSNADLAKESEDKLKQKLSMLLAQCIINNATDSVEAIINPPYGEKVRALFPLAAQLKLAAQSNNETVFKKLLAGKDSDTTKIQALFADNQVLKYAFEFGNLEIIKTIEPLLNSELFENQQSKQLLLQDISERSRELLKITLKDSLPDAFNAILKLNRDKAGSLLLTKKSDKVSILEEVLRSGNESLLEEVKDTLCDALKGVSADNVTHVMALETAIRKGLGDALNNDDLDSFESIISIATKLTNISLNSKILPDVFMGKDFQTKPKFLNLLRRYDEKGTIITRLMRNDFTTKLNRARDSGDAFVDTFKGSYEKDLLSTDFTMFDLLEMVPEEALQKQLILSVGKELNALLAPLLDGEDHAKLVNLVDPKNRVLFWETIIQGDTRAVAKSLSFRNLQEQDKQILIKLVTDNLDKMKGDAKSIKQIAENMADEKEAFLVRAFSNKDKLISLFKSKSLTLDDIEVLKRVLENKEFVNSLTLIEWCEVFSSISPSSPKKFPLESWPPLFEKLQKELAPYLHSSEGYRVLLNHVEDNLLRKEIIVKYSDEIEQFVKEDFNKLMTSAKPSAELSVILERLKDFEQNGFNINLAELLPNKEKLVGVFLNELRGRTRTVSFFDGLDFIRQGFDALAKLHVNTTGLMKRLREQIQLIPKKELSERLLADLKHCYKTSKSYDAVLAQLITISDSDDKLGAQLINAVMMLNEDLPENFTKNLSYEDLFQCYARVDKKEHQNAVLDVFHAKIAKQGAAFETFIKKAPSLTAGSDHLRGKMQQLIDNTSKKLTKIIKAPKRTKELATVKDALGQASDVLANNEEDAQLLARFKRYYKSILKTQKNLVKGGIFQSNFLKKLKGKSTAVQLRAIRKQVNEHPTDRSAIAWKIVTNYTDEQVLANPKLLFELHQVAAKKSTFGSRKISEQESQEIQQAYRDSVRSQFNPTFFKTNTKYKDAVLSMQRMKNNLENELKSDEESPKSLGNK